MKKLISLLTVLSLLLCSAALAETTADVTGEWYLALISPAGVDYAVDAATAGYQMELVLSDGGVAVIRLPEGNFPGTWSFTGNQLDLAMGDDTRSFTLSDDGVYLYANYDLMELFLTRKPEASTPVEVVPVTGLGDLKGVWKVESVNLDDNTFSWEYFVAATGLTVEDDTIVVTEDSVTIFGNEAQTGFTLTDSGILSKYADDGTPTTSLGMLSDGRMVMVTTNMLWHCVPAE